jgi:hypothetical protein
MHKEEKAYIGCLFSLLGIILLAIAAFLFGGCKSVQYVPVEKVQHDSIYITQHQRDSIYLHDSIHIREKGDTIRIEQWHTRYVEKIVRDTLIQIELDTIPQPYPVEVEVPARLSWWQQTRIHLGELLIAMILAIVGWWIYKRKGTT